MSNRCTLKINKFNKICGEAFEVRPCFHYSTEITFVTTIKIGTSENGLLVTIFCEARKTNARRLFSWIVSVLALFFARIMLKAMMNNNFEEDLKLF